MSTSSTRGGGFFVGVIYGLIASTALYLVLCYIFPYQIDPSANAADRAPVVMETLGGEAVASADAVEPTTPDVAMPEMMQPDAGGNDVIAVGGAGDTGPATLDNTQIAGTEAVSEPTVATAPAAVPDIGDGTRETSVPGVDATVPNTTNEVASSAPLAAPAELVETVSGPAIEVFASAFSGDSSKPMLAIILEDTLEGSLQPLVDSGMPLTFAVPAGIDSKITAQSIRESGFEVVALMPDGLSTSEGVAENVQRFMDNVPVAVALMDATTPSLMLNRDAMQDIIDVSAPVGLGLISYSRNGELVARAQADSAGALFGGALNISDEIQDEELIIQALNQAAFVASTNDRAIVYAKTRPTTINALLRWFGSARAGQVEIVPISVVLQRPSN